MQLGTDFSRWSDLVAHGTGGTSCWSISGCFWHQWLGPSVMWFPSCDLSCLALLLCSALFCTLQMACDPKILKARVVCECCPLLECCLNVAWTAGRLMVKRVNPPKSLTKDLVSTQGWFRNISPHSVTSWKRKIVLLGLGQHGWLRIARCTHGNRGNLRFCFSPVQSGR